MVKSGGRERREARYHPPTLAKGGRAERGWMAGAGKEGKGRGVLERWGKGVVRSWKWKSVSWKGKKEGKRLGYNGYGRV